MSSTLATDEPTRFRERCNRQGGSSNRRIYRRKARAERVVPRVVGVESGVVKRASDRVTLSGWGRVPIVEGRESLSENLPHITVGASLSRGLGRSYGDSSLPATPDACVAGSVLADRILSFDGETGLLRAEAGLSLHQLVRTFLPRGFFTPVSPGTKFVTLGGMVASDIHGKNHHRDGCFGEHVTSLKVRVADGRIVDCSPTVERDLFRATLGGMGLMGHILEVEFRMKRIPSPWIYCESVKVPDIDAYVAALKEAAPLWPQTVGWIDCSIPGKNMGRGILIKGRWAEPHEAGPHAPKPKRPVAVPFDLPSGLANRFTVRVFNALLWAKQISRVKRGVVHPESYFYPLDQLRNWNRLYGRRGMAQYQCVLPDSAGPGAARRFLELLVRRGGASPLCVIKDCGPEGIGLLSFPRPGISIAVDLPVRDDTQSLVDALNELVLAEGGRIYLAKDAFTRAVHFQAMEPRLAEWQAIRKRWDPSGRITSAQSVRVLGDVPRGERVRGGVVAAVSAPVPVATRFASHVSSPLGSNRVVALPPADKAAL
jgi:decaprenylphospho-beta-D-ribofuranose 2-oxidase